MKKLIFISILFIFITDIQALSKFSFSLQVPNMYIEEYTDTNFHNGAPFLITRDDGAIVYCINPFLTVNTDSYYEEYNYNNSIFNLSSSKLDRLNTIAYLGYNYYSHEDIKWYGITQFLIWKEIGFNDIYFTDKYYGSRIDAYKSEVSELETLVNDYYKLPSFANKKLEYNPNEEYNLIDTEQVLSNYEVLDTNIDVKKINNELIISTKENGSYEITFIKKSPIKRDYMLYNLDNAQSLFYNGKIEDITFKLYIEVDSGDIKINKLDSESMIRTFAKLEGAQYGLYKDDKLINTIITDEFGIGYIDNVNFGQYYIKEIKPSLGYQLDTNIYYINITKTNKNIVINSYENVIKGNLTINKYYGSVNSYEKENGAIFEVYDINDNLVDTLNVDGSVTNLYPFGEYYLLQTKGIKGYKFIDKFRVSIKDTKDYIFNLYDEEEIQIVEVPNTLRYDYNKFIYIGLIIIGIFIIIIEKIKETTSC